ncbi:MAG TPA: transglycosylase SLT domain-containing protein [Vicinamibacterales bacterium]|nr:transglycosylase SLT domain-containing protein [Vicinamibacterales bacterium]
MPPRAASALVFAALVVLPTGAPAPRAQAQDVPRLLPTAHPRLPDDPRDLWLAPDGAAGRTGRAGLLVRFAEGVRLYHEGRTAEALPRVSAAALASTPLAEYAAYYTGLSLLRLSRPDDATRALERLRAREPRGYLADAVLLALGEAAEQAGRFRDAIDLYAQLAERRTLDRAPVLLRLGRAALAAGDRERALEAFRRILYEFPLSDEAPVAASELALIAGSARESEEDVARELERAERLFTGRRYSAAREIFARLAPSLTGDRRELADLRVAECDFFAGRYAAARDALRPYLQDARRKGEARFFYLASLRELGEHDEYLRRVRELVDELPDSSWAEEALDNLATHYLREDDPARAAEVFRELFERFPNGSKAERAAWELGWWHYRTGEYAEAARLFETAAVRFPRGDTRPAVLYWAGRAHERLGRLPDARARYRLVAIDYRHTYYGRLATERLERVQQAASAADAGRDAVPAVAADGPSGDGDAGVEAGEEPSGRPPAPDLPPTAPLIRLLLSLSLYDDALAELQYAERQWGTSAPIQATIAWIYHQQGDLRRAMLLMRRAYPQYMTAEGQRLPAELRRVMFPLEYWDVIRRHAASRKLDPHLVASLIAQESTFQARARSRAGARGLMQIMPRVGRQLARSAGVRRFSPGLLERPDVNVRLGTLYFARLVERFGDVVYALAGYNAGPARVAQWIDERADLEREEFIEDIPFPETQNYIKKILGAADQYRALYPLRSAPPPKPRAGAPERRRSGPAAAQRPEKRRSPGRHAASSRSG